MEVIYRNQRQSSQQPATRPAISGNTRPSKSLNRHPLLQMQQAIGNRALMRLMRQTGVGSGESRTRGLQRTPNATGQIQRWTWPWSDAAKADVAPVPADSAVEVLGMGFTDTIATITFDSSPGRPLAPIRVNMSGGTDDIRLNVPAGSGGLLTLQAAYRAAETSGIVPKFVDGGARAVVRFKVTPEGKLQFTEEAHAADFGGGTAFSQRADAKSMSTQDGSSGSLTLNFSASAGTSQTVGGSTGRSSSKGRETSGEGGIDIEVAGYKSGHKDSSGNDHSSSASHSTTFGGSKNWNKSWAVTLEATPPPHAVTPALPFRTHQVYFVEGTATPSKTDPTTAAKPNAKANQKTALQQWFLGETAKDKDLINELQSHKLRFALRGEASKSGTPDFNMKLSGHRNAEVIDWLNQVVPGAVVAPGQVNAGDLGSQSSDAHDRREMVVHVSIEANPMSSAK